MKYFKTYNQFLNEGKENLDENLLDNIAKLDTLLLYSPNVKAQQEWEKTADYYLGKQEYWDQLDPMDVMNALEDAWLIMKKYNIKESVNEAKTYKKGDKLKIKLKNGKKFDVVFDSYSRTKGVALGKFKDRSGEYDTKPFNLDTIIESVNEGEVTKKTFLDLWKEIYGENFISEYPAVAKILKNRPNDIDKREISRIWDETYGEDFKEEYPGIWDKLD